MLDNVETNTILTKNNDFIFFARIVVVASIVVVAAVVFDVARFSVSINLMD